jgi:hypothetical protein
MSIRYGVIGCPDGEDMILRGGIVGKLWCFHAGKNQILL